ncbi:MAG: cytochrome c peroxidase [Phycisphaerales bacterium]
MIDALCSFGTLRGALAATLVCGSVAFAEYQASGSAGSAGSAGSSGAFGSLGDDGGDDGSAVAIGEAIGDTDGATGSVGDDLAILGRPISPEDVRVEEPLGVPPLWTPSAPFQNPTTEAKRVLGKILFWDEQLSSDNTVSCGSCHIPSSGGADPRPGRNPGFDVMMNTDDDVLGSPGVIQSDELDEYLRSALFGLEPQVTGRVAQTNLMAMFNGSLFWDGRASLNFVDPETGVLMFQSGAAGLEIQASEPILSDVEMAHAGRTWDQVREKLSGVRPLALAETVPSDMYDAIVQDPTYGELFEEAFGDQTIDAVRISFALATYQRTLIPNQSPWDLWIAGQGDAMTAQQQLGFTLFEASACNFCHPAPTFANSDFFVDGVRPPHEDIGREGVTGSPFDRGSFRTPSIRNAGVRNRLMHTGGLEDMSDILDFYAHENGQVPFPENLNGFVAAKIRFTPQARVAVLDFLENGLTDPRVVNETFPFDRPKLHAELEAANPSLVGAGEIGSGGVAPKMIAVIPPNLGNNDFKIGVDQSLGGAQAWVAVSFNGPVDGVVASDELLGPIVLNGSGAGDGYGTMKYPIPNNLALDGRTMYMQWMIEDPVATGADGFVRSEVAQLDLFCSKGVPCTVVCAGDFTGDGFSDFFDVSAFLSAFSMENAAADINGDGSFNFLDVSAFLVAFGQGCP